MTDGSVPAKLSALPGLQGDIHNWEEDRAVEMQNFLKTIPNRGKYPLQTPYILHVIHEK